MVDARATALSRHNEYASAPQRSSSVWPLLVILALLSENSKSHEDTRALQNEVHRLQQGLDKQEQTFISAVARQEGYNLPTDIEESDDQDGQTVLAKPTLGDGDFTEVIQTETTSDQPQSLNNAIDKLVGTDDPIEGMFKLFSMMAPLMFTMFVIICVKAMFRD